MLGELLRGLARRSGAGAPAPGAGRMRDEVLAMRPRLHALLREGRVAEALTELAPALAVDAGGTPVRNLIEFAIRGVSGLARQDAWRAEITYHLGTILLGLDDVEGASLCAAIAWGGADAAAGYRRFERGPDVLAYCEAAGLPAKEFPHLDVVRMDGLAAPRAEPSRTSICLLRDARVIGESFLPVSADGIAFAERCTDSPLKLERYNGIRQLDMLRMAVDSALWAAEADTDSYAGPHVLVGNHENIGHWLLFYFSRLRLVEEMPALREAKVVVGESATPLHLECLRRAGFAEDRVLRLRAGRYGAFDELWVPSMLSGISGGDVRYWHPEVLRYVRRSLGAAPPRGGGGRRIYLSRRGVRWRRLLNEDEVVAALAGLGFEECDPGTLDLQQQIDLAADASAIVGIFGAGMNFHLFAGEGVPVFQLQLDERVRMDIHPALAAVLGQPFIPVVGESARNHPDPLKSDFSVPVGNLVEVVSRALSR